MAAPSLNVVMEIANMRNAGHNFQAQAWQKLVAWTDAIGAQVGTGTPTAAKATVPQAGVSESLPSTVPVNPANPTAKSTTVVTPHAPYRKAQEVPVTPAGFALVDMADTNHLNQKLSNTNVVSGLVVSPSTSSATPSTVPELKITTTTSGRPMFLSFSVSFSNSTVGGSALFQFYLDGAPVGPEIFGCSPIIDQNVSCNASWIVTGVLAGSHEFEVDFWVTVGTVCTCNLIARSFEVIEL